MKVVEVMQNNVFLVLIFTIPKNGRLVVNLDLVQFSFKLVKLSDLQSYSQYNNNSYLSLIIYIICFYFVNCIWS